MAKKKGTTDVVVEDQHDLSVTKLLTPEWAKSVLVAKLEKEGISQEVINLHIEKCTNLEVIDETTLGLATQTIGEAAQCSRKIEKIRVEVKEPFKSCGDAVDAKAKGEFMLALNKAVDAGKGKILDWQKEQIRIKNEEMKAIEEQKKKMQEDLIKKQQADLAQQNRIQAIEAQLRLKTNACETIEQCDLLLDSVKKQFPAFESFLEFSENARMVFNAAVESIEQRKVFIVDRANVSESQKILMQQQEELRKQKELLDAQVRAQEIEAKRQQEALEASQKAADEQAAMLAKQVEVSNMGYVKGGQKRWKFQVVDFSLVPDNLKAIDEAKVRQNLSVIKDSLEDGQVIQGIRYFLETSIIAK